MTPASLTEAGHVQPGMDEKQQVSKAEMARRRRNARRTALLLMVIALAIFATFILSGVLGRGL